jgi:SMI1 / KNR4 family (SUKH-1)
MDRQEWWPFLKRWSEEWITAHDPEQDRPLDEDVVRDAWLGFAPATAEEVAAAEARLGCSLPPSLREFLLVTNGWRDAGNFIYRLAGTAELDWLRDTDDAGWTEAYSELDDGGVLGRSLRLSLAGDSAVLLLDPDDVDDNGEWAGYWLASWSGMGPERHGSFYDLMYHLYASFHDLCRRRVRRGNAGTPRSSRPGSPRSPARSTRPWRCWSRPRRSDAIVPGCCVFSCWRCSATGTPCP